MQSDGACLRVLRLNSGSFTIASATTFDVYAKVDVTAGGGGGTGVPGGGSVSNGTETNAKGFPPSTKSGAARPVGPPPHGAAG